MEDFEGNTRFALYKNFSVSSEDDSFRLSIGEYSGDAGIVKKITYTGVLTFNENMGVGKLKTYIVRQLILISVLYHLL